MSVLSDREILREVISRRVVRGIPMSEGWPGAIQPASIDVRLAGDPDRLGTNTIGLRGYPRGTFDTSVPVDPENPPEYEPRLWKLNPDWGPHYLLMPDEFLLGCTHESVRMPRDLAAQYDGRSTLGRLGLLSHCTAGWIDPGYEGNITVELKNVGPRPIILRPGMPLGQLVFHRLTTPCDVPYGDGSRASRYQGSLGTVQPRRRPHSGPEFELTGDDGTVTKHAGSSFFEGLNPAGPDRFA